MADQDLKTAIAAVLANAGGAAAPAASPQPAAPAAPAGFDYDAYVQAQIRAGVLPAPRQGAAPPAAPAAPNASSFWGAASAAAGTAPGMASPPKSDRGGQIGGYMLTDDTPVIDMSNEDREAWIKKNGLAKYYQRVQTELKGRRLRIESRR